MKSMLGFWVGWRFYRARQANGFISFISFASTTGIALGVAVLILVLSAMNGFERELEHRFLGVVSHGELIGADKPISDWRTIVSQADAIKGISGAAPFIRLEGLVQKPNGFQGLSVTGIDPSLETNVSVISKFMSSKSWQSLQTNTNHIVLGQSLLKKLGLKVGDTLSLYVPNKSNVTSNQLGAAKSHRFIITGSYHIGGELENTNAYIPMVYAAKILNLGKSVSGVRIRANNVFDAPVLIRDLGYQQQQYLYINDWTRTQGHLYSDIQLVRTMMYLVLALVIGVACFNIISTLVMAVRDKASEIAILMTMGVRRAGIMSIFMVQGALNGVLGCVLGGIIGTSVAENLTSIAKGIEHSLGIKLLDSSIYFIDFLPSEVHFSDVLIVVSMAFLMSLVATLYPAYKATKIMPARALAGC